MGRIPDLEARIARIEDILENFDEVKKAREKAEAEKRREEKARLKAEQEAQEQAEKEAKLKAAEEAKAKAEKAIQEAKRLAEEAGLKG